MPLGVPRVPYRLHNSQSEWVDIYNRLSRNRILFLCSDLNDEAANQLIGLMVYLNSENPQKEFYLYINSPGGNLIAGLALYDVIRYVNADVSTIVIGTAASMASLILSAGTRGKRIALPHARIMVHQPEGQIASSAADIERETFEILRLRDEIIQIYSERTGQTISRISKDIERDFFMSAQEAKNYNLVDAVVMQTHLIN